MLALFFAVYVHILQLFPHSGGVLLLALQQLRHVFIQRRSSVIPCTSTWTSRQLLARGVWRGARATVVTSVDSSACTVRSVDVHRGSRQAATVQVISTATTTRGGSKLIAVCHSVGGEGRGAAGAGGEMRRVAVDLLLRELQRERGRFQLLL